MSNTQQSSGGVGLGGLFLVLFVALKLTGVIAWSWLWVLAPLWLPFAFILLFLVVGTPIALIASRRK